MKKDMFRKLVLCLMLLFISYSMNVVFSQSKEVKKFESIKSNFIKSGDFKIKDGQKITSNDKTSFRQIEKKTAEKLEISAFTFQFMDYLLVGCDLYKPDRSRCEDCTLLWFDSNQDGLLQHSKELRAICKSTLRACGITVERIHQACN